jgi:hypothetical protein
VSRGAKGFQDFFEETRLEPACDLREDAARRPIAIGRKTPGWGTVRMQMSKGPSARKGNALRRYEGMNLLFFVGFVLALGVFVAFVFHSYRLEGDRESDSSTEGGGILQEAASPGSNSCVVYLGTRISESNNVYRSSLDVPVTDDGLVYGLFGIAGVTEVVINKKTVMLQKDSAARWETILPRARELISRHLHNRH